MAYSFELAVYDIDEQGADNVHIAGKLRCEVYWFGVDRARRSDSRGLSDVEINSLVARVTAEKYMNFVKPLDHLITPKLLYAHTQNKKMR
ncbi:MAG: hypothetical protein ACJ8FY_15900 [Gemmataceae bacterium]